MTRGDIELKELTDVKVFKPASDFSGQSTYTTLFLIPAFDIYLEESFYSMFINSYIGDSFLQHRFSRPLFFLIQVNDLHSEIFRKTHKYLSNNKNFVYTYSVGTHEGSYLFMYVYECPDRFALDYDRFKEGKYSTFSPDYKSKFNKTVPNFEGAYVESPIYGVLHKTDTLKKKIENIIGQSLDKGQEYFGDLVPDFEIFRYPQYSNKTKSIHHEPIKIQTAEPRER